MAQAAGSLKTATSGSSPSTENVRFSGAVTYSAKKPGKLLPIPLRLRAEDQPSREAVVAMPAVDVGVDRDLLADDEPIDAVAERVDDTHELVARDEREPRLEFAFVDVQVGAAHADLIDLDANLPDGWLGDRHVTDGEVTGRIVDNSLHGNLLRGSWPADPLRQPECAVRRVLSGIGR